jgi:hypothetical protein
MFTVTSFTKKLVSIVLAAIVVISILPFQTAAAAGLQDDPPPAEGNQNHPRLKVAFHRLERRVERIGRLLDRSDDLIGKAQSLIDKATEKGLDASAVQTALDNLIAVLPDVKTAHAEAAAIAATHTGFDNDGNVTDPEAAKTTIEELRTALQATREAMDGTGQALLQAIREFLQENKDALRPEKTPQP